MDRDPGAPTRHSPITPADDPRVLAFCSAEIPELFHAVAYRNDVFRHDPFDVESIHAEARDRVRTLIDRASRPNGGAIGRIQLLLGEAGCGKTHLMRALRDTLHADGRAYCGYLQMTSTTDHYGRYLLHNLVDSLERPYHEMLDSRSSLVRLSTALAESVPGIPAELLARVRGDALNLDDLAGAIDELTGTIVLDDRFDRIDTDLVTALLYLQTDDPRIKSRVARYLRCEPLSARDRALLGGLGSRTYDDAPQRLIAKLADLMLVLHEAPLVLCVDQLEDLYDLEKAGNCFRRAASTLSDLVGRSPSLVVIIACLEDYYATLKQELTGPLLDRIEHDPRPMTLKGRREREEVHALIAARLRSLYQNCDAAVLEDQPTAPLPEAFTERLAGMSTREVLRSCQSFRERCMIAGRLVAYPDHDDLGDGKEVVEPRIEQRIVLLEQSWNDALAESSGKVPDDEAGLAALLVEAIRQCSEAIDTGHIFDARLEDATIVVECKAAGSVVSRLRVGLCNKSAKGGALGKQVERVLALAKNDPRPMTPVLVRSTAFPSNPATMIAQQIGRFITEGGRRAVVEDAEWRAMAAMRTFRERHGASPAFVPWLKRSRPISSLEAVRTILALDALKPVRVAVEPGPEPTIGEAVAIEERAEAVATAPIGAGQERGNGAAPREEQETEGDTAIALGVSEGVLARTVTLDPGELTQHAAFLGGTGSGKTTLALNVVEQLLLRGIPAILVDRKGDLCGYARPETWSAPLDDPGLEARRERLRKVVDLAVYTPGEPGGRPLTIDVAPAGLAEATSTDRAAVAQQAAASLGGMLNYGRGIRDQSKQVILGKAIDVLAQLQPEKPVTLDILVHFIADQDPSLINAIGNLDLKNLRTLVQDLEVLRLNRGALLSAEGEPLSAETLLGLGPFARRGKTRLSIISTKFLPDVRDLEFWVAQLLIELGRWAGRSPSKRLQAVVLLDEADLYLPAIRKPATKEPMEHLLRRGRSAGLGVLLASQNPGDFDYKCRDNVRCWFLGRIGQDTSIAKMRPLLSACRGDVASRLSGQATGQFQFSREGSVAALRGGRSVLVTEQLPEDEIRALARRSGEGAVDESAAPSH